jgi:hypothetical protein
MMQQKRYNVRDYFEPSLRRFKAYSFIMDRLVKKYHPDLSAHFEANAVESKYFVQEWVTLYAYSVGIPKESLNVIILFAKFIFFWNL